MAGYSYNSQPTHYTRIGCTLIYGAIHGNEPASATLTEQLIKKLEQLPDTWRYQHRVIAIPVANPDGLQANTHANAKGVDPNQKRPQKGAFH